MNLVNKKHSRLVQSGTKALYEAFKYVRDNSSKKILLPDQGGWLSYHKDCKKLGFEIIDYKTNYGLLEYYEELFSNNTDCAIVINSSPGYIALQAMKEICESAKKHNVFVINDASGSIGTEEASYGDLIIFSAGKDKILNNFYGGYICYDDELNDYFKDKDYQVDESKLSDIDSKINEIENRWKFLLDKKNELIEKIESDSFFDDSLVLLGDGVNLIVLDETWFENEQLKESVKNHLENNYKKYQYTVCPRYIRVLEKGISFEIKRFQ